MLRRVPTGFYLLLFIALLLGTVSVYRDIFAPPTLTLRVLEAEEGSVTLLKSPAGHIFLINTGRDAGILRELGAALPFWQRRLDAVILTNAVAGNAGGLPDVIRRYRPDTLVRSPGQGSRSQETNIANATVNIPVLNVERGDRIALGGGAYADILWPPKNTEDMKISDGALVLLVSYGTTTILIQNDLPPRIAKWLAADRNLPLPDFVISSSTQLQTLISNGTTFVQK